MNGNEGRVCVTVIGTGVMGKGIVQVLAQSDNVGSIRWMGRETLNVQDAASSLRNLWSQQVRKGRLDSTLASNYAEKIQIIHRYEQVVDSQLVIEAIAENMEAKRAIFSGLAEVATQDMILASNTSSLSITELASLCPYPENLLGLHFFNPAPVMRLTEIIAGLATSRKTIDWAFDFAKSLGKEPVLVNEAPGFIVNRMLIPMINEAIGILAEGVASAEEIDKAMKFGANHPIGPLALADLIGNDVNLSIMETLHNETGDPKYRAHPLLRKMVRSNRLGRKTGQGFYKY